MQKWSPKRSKRLAQRQYALLCSALLAARPESRIVYSTCSISPLENDGVLHKLKQRGLKTAILSNGTDKMLDNAVRSADIGHDLDHVFFS